MRKHILERDTKRWKLFLISFLELFFASLVSIGVYYAAFQPIFQSAFSADVAQEEAARKEILSIGTESKLMHLQVDSSSVYSLDNSYKYYVRTLLRDAYENPLGQYDMAEDKDGYQNKKEEMSLFPKIESTTFFSDDFIGQFYTSFAAEKGLLSTTKPAKEYFIVDILGINATTLSSTYFTATNLETYPILKPEIRRALFSYQVLKIATNDYAKIDQQFYQYFSAIYENAGKTLLSYRPYKIAFDQYNASYARLESFRIGFIPASYLIAYLLLFVLPRFFTPYHASLVQLLFKRAQLDEEGEPKKRIIIIQTLLGLLKYFPAVIGVCLAGNTSALFMAFGSTPINLFLLCIIALAIDLASTMTLLIKKEPRNLFDLISGSWNYRYFIDYRDDK